MKTVNNKIRAGMQNIADIFVILNIAVGLNRKNTDWLLLQERRCLTGSVGACIVLVEEQPRKSGSWTLLSKFVEDDG